MERPHFSVFEEPLRDRVVVTMGRERAAVTSAQLREYAYGGSMDRMLGDIYDAAARDIRARLSPLERPQPRVIRSTKGARLAYPMHPGCSRARLHGR